VEKGKGKGRGRKEVWETTIKIGGRPQASNTLFGLHLMPHCVGGWEKGREENEGNRSKPKSIILEIDRRWADLREGSRHLGHVRVP
jgi:hypothetical protein